ncbi:hypothetical protein WJX84_009784 [Apatococcus fuscideae]|uniref:Uncharacterized protein n=1 Tax=Apatococcus fuscideae TaxID=2026836 RepID=A0AAW1SGN8_9CHLO
MSSTNHGTVADRAKTAETSRLQPQGLYGVPPLQTPGFMSGSSDVIEELLKEMANSNAGPQLNGRSSAFGDLTGSLPPYLGPNGTFPGMGSASDGLYGAGSGTGLGLRADAVPFSSGAYPPSHPDWNEGGGLQKDFLSSGSPYGGGTYSSYQDQGMYGYGHLPAGGMNGHFHQQQAQPWSSSHHLTSNGLPGNTSAPFPGSLANILQPGQSFPSAVGVHRQLHGKDPFWV